MKRRENMKQFNVTGMSCAACSSRVEKAVLSVSGVTNCAVSLLTNSMTVEGSAKDTDIIKAVEQAGYKASVKTGADELLSDRETPLLIKRLIISAGFLAVLMYITAGHMLFGFPVPAVLEEDPTALGILEALLTAAVMLINRKFFVSGIKGVLHKAPNMDTLVSLGSGTAFLWSIYKLIMTASVQFRDGIAAAKPLSNDYYFESAAMILVLITVGKTLEAKSRGRTTDALRSLISLTPKTATVIKGGKEQSVPIEEVIPGDYFAVKPGESIPVDGTVTEGFTAVNESALTGESIPVDKTVGSTVSAATVNTSGYIVCRATKVGKDTAISQIIKMVRDASATKAPISKIADKVAGVFVPTVMAIALLTFTVWMLVGKEAGFSLARAISVLVISCPCALGLATPVAITVGSGVGAKHGILFKTASSLEAAGKIDIVAFDKTGTVTSGTPEVTDVIPADGITKEELLNIAGSLESKSEHPLAAAVVRESEKCGAARFEVTNFNAVPGNGLFGNLGGKAVYGGSEKYISSVIGQSDYPRDMIAERSKEGQTPLLFAADGKYIGLITVADTVRPDSRSAVETLENMGISVVMITGDNQETARAVANKVGIENVIAGVLPGGKEKAITSLKSLGRAAMVGDGINDAPALTAADIGLAVGTGTDIAADAADIVLMSGSPADAAAAIKLSRRTLINIKENLFWAFFYNVLCIPLAAGCFIPFFGLTLDPMIGAAAMSLSSICVVMNALRLNLYDPYSKKRAGKIKDPVKKEDLQALLLNINNRDKETNMTKTVKIKGMMCPHCEAHVKKALESVEGVESAEASHEAGEAVVVLTKDIPDTGLFAAVTEAGYTVTGIE